MFDTGGDSSFAYKTLIFALVIMIAMPIMINNFVPQQAIDIDQEELLEDYYSFTGINKGYTKESVWVLTGVYTPYQGGSYGHTDDGWLYGSRISSYSPDQYLSSPQEFSVYRDNNGIYRYKYDTADYNADEGIGHKGSFYKATQEDVDAGRASEVGQDIKRKDPGDLYTSVVFDATKQSNIFFTASGKHGSNGEIYDAAVSDKQFYYEYTGYRYAFQPVSDSWTSDGNGNKIQITATTTSLSLIWYSYYTQSGISGQLILSGNDSGVGYINGDQIVKAFDSTTSTARFNMTFNGGVQMGIYVKMDPEALQTMTVKDAYDLGYWSVMVTSVSTDSDAYMGTDFSMNIFDIFKTMVKLLTFDYSSLNMSPMMGAICSFVIIIPLYAGLLALAINNWQMLVITGILALIETIATLVSNMGAWFSDAGSWWPWVVDPSILQAIANVIMAVMPL